MIVNQQTAYDLTLGADRREPQREDAQIIIPSTIMPVVNSLRPHSINNATTLFSDTFLAAALSSRAASQAALTTLAFTISAGLWEITFVMASWFDYVGAAASFNVNQIQINIVPGQPQVVLHRRSAIGSFTDSVVQRFLLRKSATIEMVSPVTTVAQNNELQVGINAIRVL